MMVTYGPVEISGRTYILPLRSVNIWRGRAVPLLAEWTESFLTWRTVRNADQRLRP
jgi:hypothetical protein